MMVVVMLTVCVCGRAWKQLDKTLKKTRPRLRKTRLRSALSR